MQYHALHPVKISDFGFVKFLEYATIRTLAGTYRWMAPEVLQYIILQQIIFHCFMKWLYYTRSDHAARKNNTLLWCVLLWNGSLGASELQTAFCWAIWFRCAPECVEKKGRAYCSHWYSFLISSRLFDLPCRGLPSQTHPPVIRGTSITWCRYVGRQITRFKTWQFYWLINLALYLKGTVVCGYLI